MYVRFSIFPGGFRLSARIFETIQPLLLLLMKLACIICYNEFGIKNPEGVIEIPLRLPRCKHIFGDKCIKKWFEDSNSCPYCRDKLPSEFSSKKPSDAEAFRMARERIYALSPRSRSEILAMRHLSMVGLANARFA